MTSFFDTYWWNYTAKRTSLSYPSTVLSTFLFLPIWLKNRTAGKTTVRDYRLEKTYQCELLCTWKLEPLDLGRRYVNRSQSVIVDHSRVQLLPLLSPSISRNYLHPTNQMSFLIIVFRLLWILFFIKCCLLALFVFGWQGCIGFIYLILNWIPWYWFPNLHKHLILVHIRRKKRFF